MGLADRIYDVFSRPPESKQAEDYARDLRYVEKGSVKELAELKDFAENFDQRINDDLLDRTVLQNITDTFTKKHGRAPTNQDFEGMGSEIENQVQWYRSRREELRPIIQQKYQEAAKGDVPATWNIGEMAKSAGGYALEYGLPPGMGTIAKHAYTQAFPKGPETSPTLSGGVMQGITALGRGAAGTLAGAIEGAREVTKDAPVEESPDDLAAQALEAAEWLNPLALPGKAAGALTGLPTTGELIEGVTRGGTAAGVPLQALGEALVPGKETAGEAARTIAGTALKRGVGAAVHGGVFDETLAEQYRQVSKGYFDKAAEQALREMPDASDEEVLAHAQSLYEQAVENDLSGVAIENPRLAQFASEVAYDPMTFVNPATALKKGVAAATPKLAAKLGTVAGKTALGTAGGAVLGSMAGDTGALVGGALGGVLAHPAGKQLTRKLRYMPQYDPLKTGTEEAQTLRQRALAETEKVGQWSQKEFESAAKQGEAGKELIPFITAEAKRLKKEGLFKTLEENRAVFSAKNKETAEKLLKEVDGLYGLEYSVVKHEGKSAVIPKAFAEHLDEIGKFAPPSDKWKGLQDFHNAVTKPLQSAWRKMTTIGGGPAFAIPNAITGLGLDVLARGVKALNPAHQFRAIQAAVLGAVSGVGSKKARAMMERTNVRLGSGKKAKLSEVWDAFEEHGLAGRGQVEARWGITEGFDIRRTPEMLQEFGGKLAQQDYPGKLTSVAAIVPKVADISAETFNKVSGANFLAQATENYQHFTTFLGFLDDLSPNSVAKALDLSSEFSSNYNRLGSFEKSFMRGTFGFYAWARFMGPHLVKMLYQHPDRVAGFLKARKGLAFAVGPEEGQGSWAEKRPYLRDEAVAVDPKLIQKVSKFLGGDPDKWSPEQKHDFAMLFVDDPVSAGMSIWKSYLSPLTGEVGDANEIAQMFGPLAAAAIELTTGQDIRTKRPLTDSFLEHQFKKFTTEARPYKAIENMAKLLLDNGRPEQYNSLRMRAAALRSMTGLKLYPESAVRNLARTKRKTVGKAKQEAMGEAKDLWLYE